MIITFYGENCFKIQNGDAMILTDSFNSQSGLTPPRLKPDIAIKTITPFPIIQFPDQLGKLILGAGEYNFKNIDITGFNLPNESAKKLLISVYLIKMEGIKLGILGHLSEIKLLSPIILETFKEIDLLFIPAGGSPFIDQESAIKLIKQLEPKIVIPSLFKISGLKRDADKIEKFIEKFNHQTITPQEKLTIKKKDLDGIIKTQIIVLKA